jgi:macrolide transport system ATP-binding/permease protein
MSANLSSLVAVDVLVAYGDRTVLSGVDLRASPGQRVGLIGENGSGKSTLLRVLAGEQRPGGGSVQRPSDLAYLPQEPVFAPGATVGSVLEQALIPLRKAVLEVERLAAALEHGGSRRAYAAALAWAEDHSAWDADRRAEVAAELLGVAGLERGRGVVTLSGGERSRVAMAAVLIRRPACLLLDEPTNHLDDTGVELVERTCLELPGVVVIASHDRVFLDRVSTHLVDLDPAALGTDGRGGSRFAGGFSDYLKVKVSARNRWEQVYEQQQQELGRLRAATRVLDRDVAPGRGPRDNDKFVTKFKGARVERTVSRRIHDAERRLAVAEREALPRPPRPLRLQVRLAGGGGAVEVNGLKVAGRLLLGRLSLPEGGRLLVSGANGSGKSTLLAVLAGRVRPDTGDVTASGRVGLLEQDTRFAVPQASVRDVYTEALGVERAEQVPLRSLGLLPAAVAETSVGALSTGQQRRLALAVILADPPDLLLLDEPTNHLSLALVTELEEALVTATGTVVIASHDRWLRRRWEGEQLVLGY